MTQHARRRLAAFALVLSAVTALAACGGDDGNSAEPTTSADEQSSGQPSASPTPDEPWSYDDVPGKALSYLRGSEKFKVQVKPILFQWNSQFADQPADPGSKFFTVFAAVRPELRDRGVKGLRLDEIWLRFEPEAGGCEYPSHVANVETCFIQNKMTIQPIPMDEPDWRSESWSTVEVMGGNLNDGEDYRVPLVFQVQDEAKPKNGFQICGNPDGTFSPDKTEAPCVPVPQP